jgi:C-22 sterol desaturase
MAATHNASFYSPLAQATYHKIADYGAVEGVISTISGLSVWSIVVTLFLGAVLYDQSKLSCCGTHRQSAVGN